MQTINDIIKADEEKLKECSNPNNGLNILYNLIILKNKGNDKRENYKDFKKFIDYYIEVVKLSDYGYDRLNHNKIEKILSFLNFEEQISALNYAISVSARELPEHDKNWFIDRKNKAEVQNILCKKQFRYYPKALLLVCSYSIFRLFLIVISFLLLVFVLLLPAFDPSCAIFKITYENYSDKFVLNHLLNILSHFSDIDNDFKIVPLNWFGLTLLILGKLLFILIIVNFIYRKITDKINIK